LKTSNLQLATREDDVENHVRQMGIFNWRQGTKDKDDGGQQLGSFLSFMDSGATH